MAAEISTIGSSNLFQHWYDTYVAPKKKPISLTSATAPDFSLGLPRPSAPAPGATVPGTDGVRLTPMPGYEGSAPAVPVPIPAYTGGARIVPLSSTPIQAPPASMPNASETSLAVAPPAEPAPSLTDRFNTGLSRVGEGLKDPAKMGLLTAGLSMMATPPRQVPYSNAEILGNAGLAGVNMYEKALEAKRKDELMKQTAEEHTLAREDRRQANFDRAQYYRDSAETRRFTAESLAEARKATAAENAVLDVPIDPAVAAHYGVDPKMTVRTFNKMQAGLTAMAKPEKAVKTDAFTEWYNSFGEAGPTRKDLENWHRGPGSGGGTDSGPGKVGAIGQVNRELGALYLPHAKENLSSKGPAGMEEYKGMVAMFQTTDQFGGTVNDARLRESLSPEQRKEYDFVKRKAQDYSRTMTPANAVAKAQEDWRKAHPAKPPAPAAPAPTAASGPTVKRVKMPDGSVQEFDAAGNRVK